MGNHTILWEKPEAGSVPRTKLSVKLEVSTSVGILDVELLAPAHLVAVEAGHELVDDVLQSLVGLEVEVRLGLVDLHLADGAVALRLQVEHDTAAAD